MPWTATTVEKGGTEPAPHVVIVETDAGRGDQVAASLAPHGYRMSRLDVSPKVSDLLRRERPALVVWAGDGRRVASPLDSALRAEARTGGVPVLDLVEDGLDPVAATGPQVAGDDWVFRSRIEAELPARAARLLRRSGATLERASAPLAPALPIDSHVFALVVHDLRTPLNVVGLSLRMIEMALPAHDRELDEDLRCVQDNFRLIDQMLSQLCDYYRLFEDESPVAATAFSPRRLVEELVEARGSRPAESPGVEVVADEACPREVELDPVRARMAIEYALGNALASADGSRVRVALGGGSDRWVTAVEIDRPPPRSVQPVELRPDVFERLCGTAAERRGMDLAIAARISEQFGGAARLDVLPGRGTRVVLDWPARMTAC
jgi:signal transduction histidine kinase